MTRAKRFKINFWAEIQTFEFFYMFEFDRLNREDNLKYNFVENRKKKNFICESDLENCVLEKLRYFSKFKDKSNTCDLSTLLTLLRMIILLFQDASSSSKWSFICQACRSLFRAIYQNCTCKKFQWIIATEKFASRQTFDKRQF